MTDLVQQVDDLYLRLIRMHIQLNRDWEHMPNCDYKAQYKRLVRLEIKANKRVERRLQTPHVAEEV